MRREMDGGVREQGERTEERRKGRTPSPKFLAQNQKKRVTRVKV